VAEKQHYVAFLDLAGRSCLVVGGGSLAVQKTRGLLECDARVTVVAPQAVPELRALDVTWLARPYEPADLDGRFLVIAATSNAKLQRRVFADAEAHAVPCNVPDVPELCSFILPAVHRAGPIAIAVSTGGASPALAQRLRDEVAGIVEPEHVELARRLRELRPAAKERFATYEERRAYFRSLVEEALG
jgi:precorrin-2 dehydrogenase / sirohydrochlorin ferrochelatase